MSEQSLLVAFSTPSDVQVDYQVPASSQSLFAIRRDATDPGGPGITERPLPEDEFVALWRAVVLQMFKDAANNWRTMQKPSNKARAYHNYLRAHEWLEGAWPQDFDDVCDRARLDPGWVRQRYADLKAGRITFDETMDPIENAKAATESPS